MYGGSGVVATELGMELARRGHEVHFITYAQPFRLSYFVESVYYHEVEIPSYPLFDHPPYTLALTVAIQNAAMKHDLRHPARALRVSARDIGVAGQADARTVMTSVS